MTLFFCRGWPTLCGFCKGWATPALSLSSSVLLHRINPNRPGLILWRVAKLLVANSVQLVLIFSWGVPHPSGLRVRVLTLSTSLHRINPNSHLSSPWRVAKILVANSVQLVLIFSWGVPHPSGLRVRVLTLSTSLHRINPNSHLSSPWRVAKILVANSVQLVLIFSWGVPHPSGLRVRVLTLSASLHRINPNSHLSSPCIVRPTAPGPVLWMLHQLSLYRIGVHILQLLLQLLFAPYIEIIKSALPKMLPIHPVSVKRQRQLRAVRSFSLFQEIPRDLLFQYLQYLRWIFLRRLTDQQMHMFRHHHISDDTEPVPAPNFIQDLYKTVPRPNRSQ